MFHPQWEVLLEPPYPSILLTGVWITVLLALISSVASFFLGVILAVGRASGSRTARIPCTFFCDIVRSLPGVFWLLLFFFCLPVLLPEGAGLALNGWDGFPFFAACLGLSGGIDSAVVLSMAAETLGPENIRVLLMPSQFSSDHSVEDARELAENLGVEYQIVPINETFAALTATLGPVFGELPFNVAEENMQARIRGMMMMAISNKFGNVLLATSNKSEIAVGYGTLYGDTVGALSIIGDLYKSEVYDLARYINRQREIIPLNTIMKAPSAELRLEQKDSDSLPPYDVLDAILYRMIEEGQSREEIINAGFDEDEVYKVYNLVVKSEFKRYQSCPTLRLSTRPMRTGRTMPLTNKYGC